MMNHRTTKVMLLVLGLALPLLATGCASRSTTEVDAADAALESARQPEAETSAPDTTRVAERAPTESETELATRQAREDATNMLAQLRASRDQVETMLDNAPMGKGSAADIAALRDDLGAVDVALTDIEQAMSAERFLDAIQQTQAAMESTDEIRAEIERATEAQRAATSRQG